jgi:hypothetical protein
MRSTCVTYLLVSVSACELVRYSFAALPREAPDKLES